VKFRWCLLGVEVFRLELASQPEAGEEASSADESKSFAQFGFHGERQEELVYATEEEE
jgi:hypothetical protein